MICKNGQVVTEQSGQTSGEGRGQGENTKAEWKIISSLSSLQRHQPPEEGNCPRQLSSFWLSRRELVQSMHGSRLCLLMQLGTQKRGKDKHSCHYPLLVKKMDTPTGFWSTGDSGRGLLNWRQAEISLLCHTGGSSRYQDHCSLRPHMVSSQLL